MTFMPWTKELETGIPQIDEQHKWLVDLTNKLYDSTSNDRQINSAEIGNILEQLVDYTINHFIAEETLFANLGYPETTSHVKQHNMFTHKVYSLLERHESGDDSVASIETLELLKNWLTNHIMKTDKDYIEFFRDKKVV